VLRTAAAINIVLTFILIILGAIVQSDSLGLECQSWPICYDTKQSVAFASYSMLHRIAAFFVVLINIFLLFKSDKSEVERRKYLRFGLLLLIVQSILGALNVIYKFPTIMSVFHLFLSVAYIVAFAHYIFPSKNFLKFDVEEYKPKAKDLINVIILMILGQFIIGGIIKYTVARPLCFAGQGIKLLCDNGVGEFSYWPVTLVGKLQALHLYNGIGIFVMILIFGIYVSKMAKSIFEKRRKRWMTLILGLGLFCVLHALGIRRLLLVEASNIPSILHMIYAILILVFCFGLRDWFKKTEIETFGQPVPTLLGDMFELTKPRLGLLVIATIVSGILLTGRFIDFFYLSFALFLSALVVASATTLNCWMEKEVDAKMERTKDRALPSGRLHPTIALIQGIVLIGISIPLLVIYVNVDTAVLGFIAFALYLFAYTPMKRKSPLALYVGAIPGAIPPVMGRTIVVGHIDTFGWILFAILFIWQLPHFMAISIYHNDDYMTGGIKVYSHVLSEKVLKILIFILTVVLLVVSVLPYYYGLSSFSYLIASAVLGGAFTLQSLYGFFTKSEEHYIAWARQYFWGSIIYLPLLMAAMIFLS
jgi:protoheme IX farnesyltransferase